MALATILIYPTVSQAQSLATSFTELAQVLRRGQEVIVTDTLGRRTRSVVVSVKPSELSVLLKSVRSQRSLGSRSYAESDIVKIKRVDSTNNGGFIGLGIGAGLGIAGCIQTLDECAATLFMPVVALAGIGTGAGLLIDVAIRKTIYQAGGAGRTTVSVSPLLTPQVTGASVSLHF